MAAKLILESKYFYEDILTLSNNRTCIQDAYDFQPMALAFLVNSDKIDAKYLNEEDINGYRILSKIKEVFPEVQSLKDICKINLTSYCNELYEKVGLPCNICYLYKISVVFLPCGHTCCMGCGFKVKKCHMCRAPIDKRQLMYQ